MGLKIDVLACFWMIFFHLLDLVLAASIAWMKIFPSSVGWYFPCSGFVLSSCFIKIVKWFDNAVFSSCVSFFNAMKDFGPLRSVVRICSLFPLPIAFTIFRISSKDWLEASVNEFSLDTSYTSFMGIYQSISDSLSSMLLNRLLSCASITSMPTKT